MIMDLASNTVPRFDWIQAGLIDLQWTFKGGIESRPDQSKKASELPGN